MVEVKPQRADAFAASPPDGIRFFLVYGSDAGGVTERARALERAALLRGGSDAVLRFASDMLSADPGRIADEAFSASLFGGEPVISLRVTDGRHNVIGAVQPLMERPPEAAWLIVEAGELSKTSPLRTAFEKSPAAAALPVYPLEEGSLASFIRAAAAEAGITIEPAAMELLLTALAGDRLATRNELEKLFLFVGGGGPVTPEHVVAIVSDTAEVTGDEVIDAALAGASEALETGLQRLRAEGSSAASLGAQALRYLLQLQGLRAAMDAGANAAAAMDRARPPIFSRRREAVSAQLRRWPATEISAARRRLADAILLTRKQSGLEQAAISDALHQIALRSRQLRRAAE